MIDILVIEPSVSVRKTLERLLESHGYTMRGVTRGADAVRQVSRQRPDLILSEVQLPDTETPAFGGLELCQQFSLAGLPVILMTTWIDERLRQDSQGVGALDLLSKPLAENLLLSRLARHLKLPAPVLPQQLQATPTLLSTLMTRPGLLGAALIGQAGEALEQIGAAIPEALYQPFLSPVPLNPVLLNPVPLNPVPPNAVPPNTGTGSESSRLAGPRTAPTASSSVPLGSRTEPGGASQIGGGGLTDTSNQPASALPEPFGLPELQCAQLEYLGQCLLLFRLPGETGDAETKAPASTLVCLIQNSSYASLIKYHLRSSPYVRL